MAKPSDNDPPIIPPDLGSQKARMAHELRTPIYHVLGICEMLLENRDLPESYHTDLARVHQSGRKLIHLMGKYLDESKSDTDLQKHQLLHDLRTPVNHIIGYSEMLAEQAADEGAGQLEKDLERIRAAGQTWLDLMEQSLADENNEARGMAGESASLIIDSHEKGHSTTSTSETRALTGRILVVDDDELNRDVLTRRLVQTGHQTESAVDGESALEFLAREPFDLVLLDMIMPGLSGVEVLSRMKSDDQLKHIPVIVISALDDEAGIARCIELGAEDYLGKPFNPVVLRARIETSLEKKRLRESERSYLATIEEGRQKAERLLLNILPEAIADRLKDGEEAIADHFPEVTVLFADLVNFTELSARTSPQALVGMLNRIFSSFDMLAKERGLEKIKTIGDAYMAVGGLPLPRPDHAEAVTHFAKDIMVALKQINAETENHFDLRIGIASGPAVAGIIGRNKFIYDLWGDTVNTASRMESHGEPGRIQVSETTWEQLQDSFEFIARGEIAVKGKGTMKTWFLKLD